MILSDKDIINILRCEREEDGIMIYTVEGIDFVCIPLSQYEKETKFKITKMDLIEKNEIYMEGFVAGFEASKLDEDSSKAFMKYHQFNKLEENLN